MIIFLLLFVSKTTFEHVTIFDELRNQTKREMVDLKCKKPLA